MSQIQAFPAPISNRTRSARERPTTTRQSKWNLALTALVLIGLVSFAWLNLPDKSPIEPDDAPLGLAGLATTPLTVEDAPWTADFDRHDCSTAGTFSSVTISQDNSETEQRYGLVGPVDDETGNAIVDQYRAMRACPNLYSAWNYWSIARIQELPRSLNEEAHEELGELHGYFAAVFPAQFMAVSNTLEIQEQTQENWNLATEQNVPLWPKPFDAKLNPQWGVALSDGRVAFPATVMYSASDPAIIANGLPSSSPNGSVVMIFVEEGGEWKYDDSLLLCFADCDSGVENPLNPQKATLGSFDTPGVCTAPSMTEEEVRDRTNSLPDWNDRNYTAIGPADPMNLDETASTLVMYRNCSLADDGSLLSFSLFTDLGLFKLKMGDLKIDATEKSTLAPYMRQRELGGTNLVRSNHQWSAFTVIEGASPDIYAPGGISYSPAITGDSYNRAATRNVPSSFNLANAVALSDGRIAIPHTFLVGSVDRGAITYEGSVDLHRMEISILDRVEDEWLIDEVLIVDIGQAFDIVGTAWWWDADLNGHPAVTNTTQNGTSFPLWTQPISPNECPMDEVVQVNAEHNPNAIFYTMEDYEQVSPDRDYRIVGPAPITDANDVVQRMRQWHGCSVYAYTLPITSARFEYENRTTAGRTSLEDLADQRAEGAELISDWYTETLELTPDDMFVNQDPAELALDGSELLIPQGLYNPEYAVLFADGRIGIIPSGVGYSGEDANGAPIPYFAPAMQIFIYQDSQWMLDETLRICFGECASFPELNSSGDAPATPAN